MSLVSRMVPRNNAASSIHLSSRVFLCVCHAAVSLIPNWKEEHAQIKAKKTREKPICGCFFVCCDIDQLKIEIQHSNSWYLKSTNEISEFTPSVLTENFIWRENQLVQFTSFFVYLSVTQGVFGKSFSEYARLCGGIQTEDLRNDVYIRIEKSRFG
jgi:hypothetical protein